MMNIIDVQIDFCLGAGGSALSLFIPQFYDGMGLVQSEPIFGAFQGIQLGSNSSSMSSILEVQHGSGNHFMLFIYELWDSGSFICKGIDDSCLGYATFIRVEWGRSGRSFLVGVQHPGTPKAFLDKHTVILHNGSGLVVESFLERCRGKRGIYVHEML